jgi:hypothetical protein
MSVSPDDLPAWFDEQVLSLTGRGVVRADLYYNWRCAHRDSNRPDLIDDMFHVLNATYCDVYVSKEKNQLEYAGLLPSRATRVEIYDGSPVDKWLEKLATNGATEMVPCLKLSNARLAQFLQFVEYQVIACSRRHGLRDPPCFRTFGSSGPRSSRITIARDWAFFRFELERLISLQKDARAAPRRMWSTSATSFQSNPL